MSVPVPLSNKSANQAPTTPFPALIRIRPHRKVIHQKTSVSPGKSPARHANSPSVGRVMHERVVNSPAGRHVRGATSSGKENQAPARISTPKPNPVASVNSGNSSNSSNSSNTPMAPKPIASYVVSADITRFLQSLRQNPKAVLLEAAPGRYVLYAAGQGVQEHSPGRLPAAVRLLLDLRTQMKAGICPFENKSLDGWDQYYALAYVRDFEVAVNLRPDLGLTFLAKAIEHWMDPPKVQQTSIDRILWCLQGQGAPIGF